MENSGIDHLVVAANSLEEGTNYIVETLGVRPQGGGEHTAMGTHNRLVRLGEECYLEVIAINPDAPRPKRPRWFELDSEAMASRLKQRPRLVTWALRTDRIEQLTRLSACPLGSAQSMSRGDLHWRLTLTEDGHLLESGLIPFLIQWDEPSHPASRMAESGCRLVRLYGAHPRPEAIARALRSLGAERLCEVSRSDPGSPTSLAAVIETPDGPRTLT